MVRLFLIVATLLIAGCTRLDDLNRQVALTAPQHSAEYQAMSTAKIQSRAATDTSVVPGSSLWHTGRTSLLGDYRASATGDILTVLIEINNQAEFATSTSRSRSGSEQAGISAFLGLPQRYNTLFPDAGGLDPAIGFDSSSSSSGDGSVSRNEKLTLKIAATVTRVLPNGLLEITGRQEVRVNFEVRELLVTGIVRPEDISRQNQITYDKIASARISYGGRGHIASSQLPREGQRLADDLLPF